MKIRWHDVHFGFLWRIYYKARDTWCDSRHYRDHKVIGVSKIDNRTISQMGCGKCGRDLKTWYLSWDLAKPQSAKSSPEKPSDASTT